MMKNTGKNKMDLFENPIFIFGCCNSGTTILWQTLKQHKCLSGPDLEGQDLEGLPDSLVHYLGKDTFRLWAVPEFDLAYYRTEKDYNTEDEKRIKTIYGQYLNPGTRFITKSPADTLRARLIQAYFPDAFFISIVRNGYAVSEGIRRKRAYDPDRPQFKGLSTSIEQASEQWFRANTIVLSHKEYLKEYKIIKYEDLVDNPQDTLLSVLAFCGLDANGFEPPRFEKGLNETQIEKLKEDEIKTITKIAGPMLVHFGYDRL